MTEDTPLLGCRCGWRGTLGECDCLGADGCDVFCPRCLRQFTPLAVAVQMSLFEGDGDGKEHSENGPGMGEGTLHGAGEPMPRHARDPRIPDREGIEERRGANREGYEDERNEGRLTH